MENKLSRNQVQAIFDGAPKNLDRNKIVDSLVKRGFILEGFNEPKQTLGSKLMDRATTFGKEITGQPANDILGKGGDTPVASGAEALLRTAQAPIRAVGAVGGAVNDLVGAGMEAIGLDKVIGNAVAPIVNTVANSQAGQAIKQGFNALPEDTQQVVGAIGNATSLVGEGALLKAGAKGGVKVAKVGAEGAIDVAQTVAKKITPESSGIMQRVARIPKSRQAAFENTAGESVGDYLVKRDIYGDIDQITKKLYERFEASKKTADDALAAIQGTYRSQPVRTALNELESKVERTSSPGAPDTDLARVTQLAVKERNQGLDMTEINEVKRMYERRVRLDYVKTNAPEDVTRATNVDTALREWQFGEAEKAGLKNLPEINKETRLAKQLLNDLGKEHAGSAGNNAVTLTDWIVLSGGDPTAIGGFLAKKIISSEKVRSFVAEKFAPKDGKVGPPEAKFKENLALPSPKEGSPKSSNNVAIKMNKETDSAIDFRQVKNNSKKNNPAVGQTVKATTSPSSAQEAIAKGMSEDDFVKGQGTTVYRGDYTRKQELNNSMSTSLDRDVAKSFSESGGISEMVVAKNAKIVDISILRKEILGVDKLPNPSTLTKEQFDSITGNKLLEYAKSKGYDVIDHSKSGIKSSGVKIGKVLDEQEYQIINKDILKSSSQLRAEYQAAKKR